VYADPSREELEAAHCWEDSDHVPGQPEMTAFRRRVRLHQARWREAQGHPIGSQPIAPVGASRPVGSRLPLEYARETGATFVTPAALAAARARTSFVEPQQSFDQQRLWAELLWAPALAFNVFGDLAADLTRADRAAHTWWPDTPGTVSEVRFAHSPGRLDRAWLNSLRAFDAAFILDLDDGTHGVVGVAVNYNDWLKPEIPKPTNLARYLEVAERSTAFAPHATDQVKGRSPLAVMWLEHLLLLSMLQHESGGYTWGRYVVVFPAGNVDVAAGCARYRGLLADDSTFATATLESLLAGRALPRPTVAALRERYVADG
jgi:PD-(D/E)XK nuclease superfamily